MSEYDALLEKLRSDRLEAEGAKATRDEILEDLKKNNNYLSNDFIYKQALERIADTEEKIKMLAHTEWLNTKNKNPHPSVAVKIFKTFKVINADAVREWVLKNLPAALSPDMSKVQKYAMEIGPVDGTEKGEEARV